MAVNLNLKANPDPVVIDTASGATVGTTTIEYWKQADHNLWSRDRPGPWRPVSISATGPTDSAHTHGTYVSEDLKPGQVYEVAIWPSDNDPNYPEPEKPEDALKAIAVFALRKAPEEGHFLESEDWTIGGTHCRHFVYASRPVNAYEALSTEAPTHDAAGNKVMSQTLAGSAWSPTAENHVLGVDDLLPGTKYYLFTRLSDEAGNWEVFWNEKTTKLRQIEFRVTSIFVNDDSDDLSDGEGGMSWTLETGPVFAAESQWRERGQISYTGDYGSGNWVDAPSDVILIGPEPVDPASRALRLRFYVWDRDTPSFPWPDDGDSAEKVSALLSLKLPNEDVLDQEGEIVAGPGGDDLQVTSKFKYSVRYL